MKTSWLGQVYPMGYSLGGLQGEKHLFCLSLNIALIQILRGETVVGDKLFENKISSSSLARLLVRHLVIRGGFTIRRGRHPLITHYQNE